MRRKKFGKSLVIGTLLFEEKKFGWLKWSIFNICVSLSTSVSSMSFVASLYWNSWKHFLYNCQYQYITCRYLIIFKQWVFSYQHFQFSSLLPLVILAQNTRCKIMKTLYWILLFSRNFLVLSLLWMNLIKVVLVLALNFKSINLCSLRWQDDQESKPLCVYFYHGYWHTIVSFGFSLQVISIGGCPFITLA